MLLLMTSNHSRCAIIYCDNVGRRSRILCQERSSWFSGMVMVSCIVGMLLLLARNGTTRVLLVYIVEVIGRIGPKAILDERVGTTIS